MLEKTLKIHWTARRLNQSILKEISPEYSLEGLMLKLKVQYFSHLMPRPDSSEKTLMLGKIEGRRRRGWQRMRWLDGITDLIGVWASSGNWSWKPGVLQSVGSQRGQHDWRIPMVYVFVSLRPTQFLLEHTLIICNVEHLTMCDIPFKQFMCRITFDFHNNYIR